MLKSSLFYTGIVNLIISSILFLFIWKIKLYLHVIVFLIIIWIISTILTDKYKIKFIGRYFSYHLTPYLKAFIAMLILISVYSMFNNEPFVFIKLLFIATATSIFDIICRYIYYRIKRNKENDSINQDVFKYDANLQDSLVFNNDKIININSIDITFSIEEEALLIISNYLSETDDTELGNSSNKIIIDKNNPNHIITSDTKADFYFLNYILNNIKHIGRKLKNVVLAVNAGGWLLIKYKPLEITEQEVRSKILSKYFYIIYFINKRVFPKIPGINKLYYFITKGKNRVISRTETWGRLMYYGFDVIKEVNAGNHVLLLARKTKSVSLNKNPSYYHIIRLNRIGYMGKIFQTIKVRSMYPFSEFLQQRIFEEKGMSADGHFNNDPRITNYGRFIRKYWLDELPQILDWLKGNIKLVGLRAMSLQYFNIHSKEYQNKFLSIMPGLIPPIFDSESKSFDEIAKIEEDYVDFYTANRFSTDINYFLSTLKLILFKRVRSG